MKNILAALACALAAPACAITSPADYVLPLMGSQSTYAMSTGNTYPATCLPWGMNFWTPQTGKMGDGWVYTYTADKIRGFKQTHQPSPWINDYGQFALMPTTGAPVFDEDKRASWFSHKAEESRPYYYKVYLADHDIVAEMAPTERACIMRFTFPETDSANVVIDAYDHGSLTRVIPEQNTVVGYSTRNSGGVPEGFRNYFAIRFSKPFSAFAVTDCTRMMSEPYREMEGQHTGAVVSFKTRRGEQVLVRVASSFISEEQALRNLGELADDSFETVKQKGRQRWNDVLSRVEIGAGAETDQLRTFYTCLYRTLLFPRCLAEKDARGRVVHYSPYNGEVREGYMFTDTGFWDTFRALFPLLNLVYPDEAVKMQEGLVNAYKESGFLPEWASPGHRGCMVGNNSASIVADAYLKGLRGYDIETLWQALIHDAHAVHPDVSSTGRQGFEYYDKLGYVPYDVKINENVARTLEYSYDDWCIYQLGLALGKKKKELEPYRKGALNYRNVFDPETRLMRGRNADGTFQSPFSPYKWGDAFTEGNAWHWTWCVFHDPTGLATLMGGGAEMEHMMDSVFVVPPIFDDSYYGQTIHEIREMQVMNMGNYAHGNQPIQHMLYLYDWTPAPWKAQQHLRDVMDRMYTPTPDGYCGDEDNGQTSAWYVFSALGFYPVCPGSGQYALGAPYFPQATLHLQGGKDVVIEAPGVSADNRYVGALTIDGAPHAANFLTHTQLTGGARLHFTMQAQPDRQRGAAPQSRPYSLSK